MDFDLKPDQQVENVYDEEYTERDIPARQEVENELKKNDYKRWTMGRKKVIADEEDEEEIDSPTRSRSSKKKKKKKVEMFPGKLVFKILVIVAVFFNIKFILKFMKGPVSNLTFYHTLFVVGISAGINFIAAWILFYKSSFMRFYISLVAILGSFGYYFYVNYTNQSFLGNNLITSVLVIISVLMTVHPHVNYYLKSIVLMLIPILGIYLSSNKFALVWTLMLSAGLVLLFRVSKSKSKSKTNKQKGRARRKQKQSA